MNTIAQNRIDAMFREEDLSGRLLAKIYCTILTSGKYDGEYSDRDKYLMQEIQDHMGEKARYVLDAAILEERKLAV